MEGKKILIVDDEQDICELLRIQFQELGFRVETAYSAEEFEKKVFFEKPSVIILDIVLGDKNGPDVYDRLLHRGLDQKIPVVFMSALAVDRTVEHASAGRQYSLYAKPFDLKEFVGEVAGFALTQK